MGQNQTILDTLPHWGSDIYKSSPVHFTATQQWVKNTRNIVWKEIPMFNNSFAQFCSALLSFGNITSITFIFYAISRLLCNVK